MLLCTISGLAYAGQDDNINQIGQDLIKVKQSDGRVTQAWWMPKEYWEFIKQRNKSQNNSGTDRVIGLFEKYNIFAIVDVRIDKNGNLTDQASNNVDIKLRLSNGNIENPIKHSQLTKDELEIIEMVKPLLSQTFGKFGDAAHIFVFSGLNADGKRHMTVKQKGQFSLVVNKIDFKWVLPLPSFIPAMFDPVTGDEFPGSYVFNPFTGQRLKAK